MTDIQQFVEKPRKIEAMRYAGEQDELMAVVEWVQAAGYTLYNMFSPTTGLVVSIDPASGYLQIVDISEDGATNVLHTAQPGDWVIKDWTGSISTMTAAEFDNCWELED